MDTCNQLDNLYKEFDAAIESWFKANDKTMKELAEALVILNDLKHEHPYPLKFKP